MPQCSSEIVFYKHPSMAMSIGIFHCIMIALVESYMIYFRNDRRGPYFGHIWANFAGQAVTGMTPTSLPMGPYPLFSPKTCTAIQASLNSILGLILGELCASASFACSASPVQLRLFSFACSASPSQLGQLITRGNKTFFRNLFGQRSQREDVL